MGRPAAHLGRELALILLLPARDVLGLVRRAEPRVERGDALGEVRVARPALGRSGNSRWSEVGCAHWTASETAPHVRDYYVRLATDLLLALLLILLLGTCDLSR